MTLDDETFRGGDPKPGARAAKDSTPSKGDPKPAKRPRKKIRVEDPKATTRAVLADRECFCGGRIDGCNGVAVNGHHIIPKGAPHFGDDVVENVAPASGSGTTGCHGLLHARDPKACKLLGEWVMARPVAIGYVLAKLGETAGLDYMTRRYGVEAR